MAIPTVSASLDKTSYTPGSVVTLTVNYGDADNQTFTVTTTITDAEGNHASATNQLVINDGLTLAVVDTGNRTWTKVSDNGSVAVFTTTA